MQTSAMAGFEYAKATVAFIAEHPTLKHLVSEATPVAKELLAVVQKSELYGTLAAKLPASVVKYLPAAEACDACEKKSSAACDK